jgi:hypothetical protein
MPIHDVISELNRLQSQGLISDYAIGGAVAANAYIEPADTEDLDVFVVVSLDESNSLDPLTNVNADLVAHGATWHGMYLVIGGWPVQLLLPGSDLYEDAIAHGRASVFADGLSAKIMGPEHLVAIALATGRLKDYVRVVEFLRRGVVDRAHLEDLVKKYGLTQQWLNFESRFLDDDA